MKPQHIPQRRQRGMATLAIVLMLVGLVMLGLAYSHRALLFEQKSASNQYRAAQAFEAAEAGLEWATAQLNLDAPVDDNCLPLATGHAADTRAVFRDRYLDISADDGRLTPRGLQAACQLEDMGWSCTCPSSGTVSLAVSSSRTAFLIHFEAHEKTGLVQLHAQACIGPGTPCVPGHSGSAEASAQLQVTLGRTAGLATEPGSPLTVRGRIDAPLATLTLNNADAPSGIALHSGGGIDAALLRMAAFPGTPLSATRYGDDAELARLSPTAFFASVFHMSKDAWARQPSVRRISCSTSCDDALATALAASNVGTLLWVDHGLKLERPAVIGTPERPVLLVVDGPVDLQAPIMLNGAVYGTHADWNDPAGSTVHGALIFENDFKTRAATRIDHDQAVLHRLHVLTGTFARVAGSWRDF